MTNEARGIEERATRRGNGLLAVSELSAFYGDAQALKAISMSVEKKEVVAVLGSNGAGKSTLLKTITGLLDARMGTISFDRQDITSLPPEKIIRKGIASVPEGRQLFGPMSVWDNLLLGTYCLPKQERQEMTTTRLEMILKLFPILKARLRQAAETLSGGEQQMLALGRALMSNPKLLALDEPSLGLSPLLVREMMKLLELIGHELGISILLVEQNARAAVRIADFAYVLERGEIIMENTAEQIMASEEIQSAYLGG